TAPRSPDSDIATNSSLSFCTGGISVGTGVRRRLMGISRRDVTTGLASALAAQALAPPAGAQTAPQPTNMTPPPHAPRLSQAQLETATAPADNAAHQIIYLWPHGAPGMPHEQPNEQVVERAPPGAPLHDRALFHILRPRLVVFRPENPNGAALLLCPG